MKTLGKTLLGILLAVLTIVIFMFVWIISSEYTPDAVEPVEIKSEIETTALKPGQDLSVTSWNIGYGGLGAGSDFFMDGGKNTKSADETTVRAYLGGIEDYLSESAPDIVMLQEVDRNSSRTYSIDERQELTMGQSTYAMNYSCVFVPIPVPPIGRVNSGVFTTTGFEIERAERVALPCPFSWPVSAANLKRCLLVSYLPIEGTDSQLVLVNLHLEAYDDGEGKLAQTKQLRKFIENEYAEGNYVIACGDFNQTFPGGNEAFPVKNPDLWVPGTLSDELLPDGWELAYDLGTPSCRLLNQPYDPADTEHTQHYVIDGFILSPNIQLNSVECVDLGFENSDHNPVRIEVTLKDVE